jgi:hypothetical protein
LLSLSPPNHLTTLDHSQPSIHRSSSHSLPHQPLINIININMRSSAVFFGVAALVAAVSGQTGMFAHSQLQR